MAQSASGDPFALSGIRGQQLQEDLVAYRRFRRALLVLRHPQTAVVEQGLKRAVELIRVELT